MIGLGVGSKTRNERQVQVPSHLRRLCHSLPSRYIVVNAGELDRERERDYEAVPLSFVECVVCFDCFVVL